MNNEEIMEVNKNYWNEHADLWFGTTALPKYGVHFPTEDDMKLFENINGKKILEICIRCFIMRKEEQENCGELICPKNSLKMQRSY